MLKPISKNAGAKINIPLIAICKTASDPSANTNAIGFAAGKATAKVDDRHNADRFKRNTIKRAKLRIVLRSVVIAYNRTDPLNIARINRRKNRLRKKDNRSCGNAVRTDHVHQNNVHCNHGNGNGKHTHHLAHAVLAGFEQGFSVKLRTDKTEGSISVCKKEYYPYNRLQHISRRSGISRTGNAKRNHRHKNIIQYNIGCSAGKGKPKAKPRFSRSNKENLEHNVTIAKGISIKIGTA